ncbi:hypothetical protein VZT92_024150 [Zoarces viviparus]|uniref:Uncharacterized protein n=1 Tax=Zoarces viviparus TaxID=48416 RepID=A0AAW1E1X6_ZOAVI
MSDMSGMKWRADGRRQEVQEEQKKKSGMFNLSNVDSESRKLQDLRGVKTRFSSTLLFMSGTKRPTRRERSFTPRVGVSVNSPE